MHIDEIVEIKLNNTPIKIRILNNENTRKERDNKYEALFGLRNLPRNPNTDWFLNGRALELFDVMIADYHAGFDNGEYASLHEAEEAARNDVRMIMRADHTLHANKAYNDAYALSMLSNNFTLQGNTIVVQDVEDLKHSISVQIDPLWFDNTEYDQRQLASWQPSAPKIMKRNPVEKVIGFIYAIYKQNPLLQRQMLVLMQQEFAEIASDEMIKARKEEEAQARVGFHDPRSTGSSSDSIASTDA